MYSRYFASGEWFTALDIARAALADPARKAPAYFLLRGSVWARLEPAEVLFRWKALLAKAKAEPEAVHEEISKP